jgi:hypothetical protein
MKASNIMIVYVNNDMSQRANMHNFEEYKPILLEKKI